MNDVFNKEYVEELIRLNDHKAALFYCQNYNENYYDYLFEYLNSAVQTGDAKIYNDLGNCYIEGLGTARSFDNAIAYYKKAAELGLVESMTNLADCYYSVGNNSEALKWLEMAAEKKDAIAMFEIGEHYKYIVHDEKKAFNYYLQAAENENSDAQFEIGTFYMEGKYVEKSREIALIWFNKAAQNGNMAAKLAIRLIMKEGSNKPKDNNEQIARKNYNEGMELLKKGNVGRAIKSITKAAKRGLAEAQYRLSLLNWKTNKKDALKWLNDAANNGYDLAQYKLGYYYLIEAGHQKDEHKAFKYFMLAAEQKLAIAECMIGCCYIEGIGVEVNFTEAYKWTKRAAEHGDIFGQYRYAVALYYGFGCDKDINSALIEFQKLAEHIPEDHECKFVYNAEAFIGKCYDRVMDNLSAGKDLSEGCELAYQWYKKSAEHGSPIGQFYLGFYYENGVVVQRDIFTAQEMYKLSAQGGFETADKANTRLKETWNKALTSEECGEMLRNAEASFQKTTYAFEREISSLEEEKSELKKDLAVKDEQIDKLRNYIEMILPDIFDNHRGELSHKIKDAANDEERDEMIQEWFSSLDNYISNNIGKIGDDKDVTDAEKQLKEVFGDAWGWLDESMRTSLISSRVLWQKTKHLDSSFDFSGIVITATSALEALLTRIFLTDFQGFLKSNNIPERNWPATLLYRQKDGSLIANKYFYLGNFKYLLGQGPDGFSRWTVNQVNSINNYLESIIESDTKYSALEMLTKKEFNDKTIYMRIDHIRDKYRNKAAHTSIMKKEAAINCYYELISIKQDLEDIENIKEIINADLNEINNIITLLYSIMKK